MTLWQPTSVHNIRTLEQKQRNGSLLLVLSDQQQQNSQNALCNDVKLRKAGNQKQELDLKEPSLTLDMFSVSRFFISLQNSILNLNLDLVI